MSILESFHARLKNAAHAHMNPVIRCCIAKTITWIWGRWGGCCLSLCLRLLNKNHQPLIAHALKDAGFLVASHLSSFGP